MSAPFGQNYRLVPRGGAGLACDEDGLALGPVSLTTAIQIAEGRRDFRMRSAAEVTKALQIAYGTTDNETISRRQRGLARVTELLAAGDGVRARVHAVLLAFPEIDSEGMAKLAEAVSLKKFNPNWPNEPRIPDGRPGAEEWTIDRGGGNSGKDAALKPKKETLEDIRVKKQRFVNAHLADAQKAADQLHVPVENVLGIAAVESRWGQSRFAVKGNNYFGLHYPAPYSTGALTAERKSKGNKKVRVAKFASFADCLRAFVRIARPYVSGKADPVSFGAAAQGSGKFGIDTDTGKPRPGYIAGMAWTIVGLRRNVAHLQGAP